EFFIFWLLIVNISLSGQGGKNQKIIEFGLEKAKPLGSPINSMAGEYAPTISADGQFMIFESDRDEKYNWKLYITHKTDSGWTHPVRLDSVNSNQWDGAPFLTYDQNYLYLSSERAGGAGDIDIWISQRLGESWTKPQNIGAPINTKGYDGFASLSSDGKVLYFKRDAPEKAKCSSKYHFDLYYSVLKDGKWQEPKKLRPPINSEYCEGSHIILPDSRTLIFSSDRPGGFGGHDLYKTEKKVDGSWSEPVNLGSFINTAKDESIVSVPASGDVMYFTSGDEYTPDIYVVPIPIKHQYKPVITVTGTIRDAITNYPLIAQVTIIDAETGRDTTIVESNKTDGKYIVILNQGKLYDVSVKSKNHTFHSTQFDLRKPGNYSENKQDILLEPMKVGTKFNLNNLYFKFGSDSILTESRYELQRAIELIKENSMMVVEIAAHTDSIGSDRFNQKLSSRRAERIVQLMAKNGIDHRRLVAIGYGRKYPVATNTTEEGRKQNRRVEFKILELKNLDSVNKLN
ncbi:PD40 domain-containing protein, partial [candidate division KSB1 bacterium]|nr:PD40 domain-containing protein [candidate division KSB1 bacterium]